MPNHNNTKLESNRLLLRQWKETDFEAFASYYANEELAQYVGGVKTREEAWRLMASYIGHWQMKGFGYWAVEEKESSNFVGAVGLWKSPEWPDIGTWLLDHGRHARQRLRL